MKKGRGKERVMKEKEGRMIKGRERVLKGGVIQWEGKGG